MVALSRTASSDTPQTGTPLRARPRFVEIVATLVPPATAVISVPAVPAGCPGTATARDAHGRDVPLPLGIRQALSRWIRQALTVEARRACELDLPSGRLTVSPAEGSHHGNVKAA